MIITIFGKKGSGKTTLTKEWILRLGGRVVFLSPVEYIKADYEAWTLQEIERYMFILQRGEILTVRLARPEALDLISCIAILRKSFTIAIDEMNEYQGAKDFLDLVHYCRHFETHIIANTRRYADMPRLLTSQADILCVFRTNEPRDIDYIRHFTSTDFAQRVKTLPERYSYLEYPSEEIKNTRPIDI